MITKLTPVSAVPIFVLLVCACPVGSTIIHVSASGSDTFDGSTWKTAKATVAAGVGAASEDDEVWVVAGTYAERLTVKAGVGLYGGFVGTERHRSQRPSTYRSVLYPTTGSGAVVTVPEGAGTTTVIDGFQISGGKGTVGGGISCASASPTITNDIISANTAECGAGIYCGSGSNPVITANVITQNTASTVRLSGSGGAIYSIDSSPIITNNRIFANTAEYGGAITCSDGASGAIANNIIYGNAGMSGAGGIYCCGAAAPAVVNNTIVRNTGRFGGISCMTGAAATIANNIVAFNSSGISAAGGTNLLLRNNCVYGNRSFDCSGVVSVNGMFLDPKLNFEQYGWFQLLPDSPCVDAGDDTFVQPEWTDFDGAPRVSGQHVDIGAYESKLTPPVPDPLPVIVRVSPEGDDANDGSAWDEAKKTIQAAVSAAAAAGGEVWVKAGAYNEHINLPMFVYLYGGFNGTETERSQRNWNTSVTILDGQQNGTVVTTANSGHMLNAIDGFTIRNGTETAVGGGIRCESSSPDITNNVIRGNSAYSGGGVCCSHSASLIRDNYITENYASYQQAGGGIYCSHSSPMISGNRVIGNKRPEGGDFSSGIYCQLSSPTITGNVIAASRYTGIFCSSSSPDITNNTIVANRGAAVYCTYADFYPSAPLSAPVIANNIIASNNGGIGIGSRSMGKPSYPSMRRNCMYNNILWGDYYGFTIPPTTDDIHTDPVLVRPTGKPDDVLPLAWDYHLWVESPCIDAGEDSLVQNGQVDIDGQTRPMGSHVDIGADEYGLTLPTPTFTGRYNPNYGTIAVTIACSEPGAVIHFTTNGEDPTEGDAIVTGPVEVAKPTLTKARAWKPGWACSAVAGQAFTLVEPPQAAVLIDSGAPITTSQQVTLTLSAPDPATSEMAFSNDGVNWSDWEPYATTKIWDLPYSEGVKTVYVTFAVELDPPGLSLSTTHSSILLDVQPPFGRISINGGAAATNSTSVVLTLSAVDAASGVLGMRFRNGGSVWSAWEPFATLKNWSLLPGDGQKTVYVQYVDAAGLVVAEDGISDTIILDTQGPSGAVTINDGAAYTGSTSVQLDVSATDSGGGVSQMRFRNESGIWSAWEQYAVGTREWKLPVGDGIKTVYAEYKDTFGCVSPVCGDTIYLDTSPPVVSSIADDGLYTTGLSSLHATWNAADAQSGVVEVRYAVGTSPSDLITGWTPAMSEATEDGLTLQQNETYYWYIKAKSGAGLWSGAVASDGVTAAQPATVGKARLDDVGSAVFTEGTVTSTPTDGAGLWIESADRSSAIAISADWTVSRGDVLQIAGVVSLVDGVFSLSTPELKGRNSGSPPIPLGAANSQVANDRRESLQYAGVNPVGLLMTTWGKVTFVDPVNRVFYIDDGSNLADGIGQGSGLRIVYGPGVTPPAVEEFVSVTGIRTVEKAVLSSDAVVNGEQRSQGEEVYVPEIYLRDQADLIETRM